MFPDQDAIHNNIAQVKFHTQLDERLIAESSHDYTTTKIDISQNCQFLQHYSRKPRHPSISLGSKISCEWFRE
jgi:hypothetical protein